MLAPDEGEAVGSNPTPSTKDGRADVAPEVVVVLTILRLVAMGGVGLFYYLLYRRAKASDAGSDGV